MTLRLLPALALLAALLPAAPALATHDDPASLASLPLESESSDRGRGCTHRAQPGALALERWLADHSPLGTSWGIENCRRVRGSRNWSLHAEGRAVDWRLDIHDAAQRREAERIVRMLMARDSRGRPRALARRMGVQELIWDCRIWNPGLSGMRPYSRCYRRGRYNPRIDDTSAHRDHVHIGLNWAGARGRTSFWRATRLWR